MSRARDLEQSKNIIVRVGEGGTQEAVNQVIWKTRRAEPQNGASQKIIIFKKLIL